MVGTRVDAGKTEEGWGKEGAQDTGEKGMGANLAGKREEPSVGGAQVCK
jgi:hypothetical protein